MGLKDLIMIKTKDTQGTPPALFRKGGNDGEEGGGDASAC